MPLPFRENQNKTATQAAGVSTINDLALAVIATACWDGGAPPLFLPWYGARMFDILRGEVVAFQW